MSEDRDKFYRRKYALKRKAHALGKRYSRIFRAVKLGDELHIGEASDLANDTVDVGREFERMAVEAGELDLEPRVFTDISREAFKLREFSKLLREVAESYSGFSVRTLPVYEPGIRQEAARSQIGAMIKELED